MKNILKQLLKSALPHLLAIFIFGGIAYLYCKPAFEDKVLSQEDVLQWQGMSHNSFEYKEKHGHFPLWSNSMYGGMPGYQIAMDTRSVNIPDLFYGALTFYLAKPASFFFLACICFYFLAGALRINPYIGIIGALAYAYATYNAVIIAVGHDTKMQSIAMIPGVIGALILICERKYWLGMVLLALFSALLVSVNHIQIMYYILIIAVGLLAGYGISWIRKGEGRRLGQVILMAAGATLVGILSNAVVIFTTYDASKESTRAGSELTDNTGNTAHNGLTDSAAFEFSMYKLEPLVMLVPDIFGGSTDLQLPSQRSRAIRVMDQMPPDLVARIGEDGPRYYWGGVGKFFAGPPYAGAIIILLVIIGLFVLDNRHKWWILSVSLLAILMSWGGYFLFFNQFLLKWLPLYNKFRAPSMILVIPTFLFCLMGVLTLDKIWLAENRTDLWRQYKWGLLSTAGVFLVLLGLYFHFNYSSPWETDLLKKTKEHGSSAIGYMQAFVHALREDRQTLFGNSLLRSFSLMLAGAFIIGLYIRKRISPGFLLAVIGILIFGDVLSLDLNYLNEDNYMEKDEYLQNFAATDADRQILQDKGYFRVFDVRDSAYNALTYGAMTAYLHFSIGGYHAAKLKIYEDLITRQLYNFPNCKPVINMLNTKYIIKPVAGGGDSVLRNNGSLGPVWFVKAVRFEPTAQDVMNQLSYFNPKDTAIVFAADSGNVRLSAVAADNPAASADTAGSISLVKNDNDEITYLSQSQGKRFAVFSEVYYNRGWRAWIDDHEAPIIRTNYVLRGLSIPPGRHVIRFFFRPLSFYLGRQIQWMASIIFLLMMVGAIIVAIQEFTHESDSFHGGALLQAA